MLIKNQPLVSIITATYNTAKYLPETIESVLSQTYGNIEYIVLDDGSTDDTPLMLSRYEDDKRFKWVSHSNMGESASVNKGWRMANGDYVIVVSADDPVYCQMVEKEVEFMEAHSKILVGYPHWNMIDEHSNVMFEHAMFDYNYVNMVRWHYCMAGPGSIIRRNTFDFERERDISFRYCADYEYWVRVGLHGPFARIPQILATWRYHPQSSSVARRGESMASEHVRLIEKLYARPDVPPEINRIKDEALSVANYVAGLRCFEVGSPKARDYFLRAILLAPFAPLKYPSGLKRSWPLMVQAIFSLNLQKTKCHA